MRFLWTFHSCFLTTSRLVLLLRTYSQCDRTKWSDKVSNWSYFRMSLQGVLTTRIRRWNYTEDCTQFLRSTAWSVRTTSTSEERKNRTLLMDLADNAMGLVILIAPGVKPLVLITIFFKCKIKRTKCLLRYVTLWKKFPSVMGACNCSLAREYSTIRGWVKIFG